MEQRAQLSALRDGDADAQSRAALAIYDSSAQQNVLRDEELAAALRASVAGGNRSAAAILLLAYDPSKQAAELLNEVKQGTVGKQAKLREWTQAVEIALVADVALSRRGDSDARVSLLEKIGEGALETYAFLLDVLREVDDPAVLHALKKALEDERAISGGVPSGAAPSRRIADRAVDAFIERLGLGVGFRPDPSRRYSPEEIGEVNRLIGSSIPQ
jgi:hypothetical protein